MFRFLSKNSMESMEIRYWDNSGSESVMSIFAGENVGFSHNLGRLVPFYPQLPNKNAAPATAGFAEAGAFSCFNFMLLICK